MPCAARLTAEGTTQGRGQRDAEARPQWAADRVIDASGEDGSRGTVRAVREEGGNGTRQPSHDAVVYRRSLECGDGRWERGTSAA